MGSKMPNPCPGGPKPPASPAPPPAKSGTARKVARPAANQVDLGVIEFHADEINPGLTDRFYAVTKDLADAGCIVDVWLMDIASVLAEFGYEMKVFRGPEAQERWETR